MTERGRIRVDWQMFAGCAFFLMIGGGFAIFGGYQLVTTHLFMRDAVPLAATVIENPESCDDDGCTWWPTVRFDDPDGVVREARTRHGASNYDWGEGARIDILYNPRWTYVRVPGADNLYLLGGAFFALGMLPVCIAVWLLSRFTFRRG